MHHKISSLGNKTIKRCKASAGLDDASEDRAIAVMDMGQVRLACDLCLILLIAIFVVATYPCWLLFLLNVRTASSFYDLTNAYFCP